LAGSASAPSAALPVAVRAVRAAMVVQLVIAVVVADASAGLTVPAGAVRESGTVARAVWESPTGVAVHAG